METTRSPRHNRIARFLIPSLLAIGAAVPGPVDAQARSVWTITAQDAADIVRRDAGLVRLVLIYSATCPASRLMFPEFLRLADDVHAWGVSTSAFSVDPDAAITERYLRGRSTPFRPYQIRRGVPGDIDRALTPVGLEIGASFGTPLIAVIDGDGRVVGQWEGGRGAAKAREWLREVGIKP